MVGVKDGTGVVGVDDGNDVETFVGGAVGRDEGDGEIGLSVGSGKLTSNGIGVGCSLGLNEGGELGIFVGSGKTSRKEPSGGVETVYITSKGVPETTV